MSKLLINEPPLQVLPSLACKIGLNEAIFLQQIHYWLQNPKVGKFVDNEKWLRNTIDQWHANFPFWSRTTVDRTVKSLEKKRLIWTRDDLNDAKYDRTKWYRVNYNRLTEIEVKTEKPIPQNGVWVEATPQNGTATPQNGTAIPQNGTAIPQNGESYTRDNTETTHKQPEINNSMHAAASLFSWIDEPKRSKLAALEHVTPEYHAAWLENWEAKNFPGWVDKNPAGWQVKEIEAGNWPPALASANGSGPADGIDHQQRFTELIHIIRIDLGGGSEAVDWTRRNYYELEDSHSLEEIAEMAIEAVL